MLELTRFHLQKKTYSFHTELLTIHTGRPTNGQNKEPKLVETKLSLISTHCFLSVSTIYSQIQIILISKYKTVKNVTVLQEIKSPKKKKLFVCVCYGGGGRVMVGLSSYTVFISVL